MAKKTNVWKGFLVALSCALSGVAVSAQELRLAAPVEMADSGFLRHLLPRFKLKHRIAVLPVAPGSTSEMALSADAPGGTPVFGDTQGAVFRLRIIAASPEADKFLDWLQSDPGKAAITGFPRDAPPTYVTEIAEETETIAPEITGNAALGADLALRHCGRCHVVDKRNRMGGIGSTPSFAAMRARGHWFDLFGAYWTQNPHPSFTEVIGVTEPFSASNLSHIAPVKITLEEIDAILAFVETLVPLDLGAPVKLE